MCKKCAGFCWIGPRELLNFSDKSTRPALGDNTGIEVTDRRLRAMPFLSRVVLDSHGNGSNRVVEDCALVFTSAMPGTMRHAAAGNARQRIQAS